MVWSSSSSFLCVLCKNHWTASRSILFIGSLHLTLSDTHLDAHMHKWWIIGLPSTTAWKGRRPTIADPGRGDWPRLWQHWTAWTISQVNSKSSVRVDVTTFFHWKPPLRALDMRVNSFIISMSLKIIRESPVQIKHHLIHFDSLLDPLHSPPPPHTHTHKFKCKIHARVIAWDIYRWVGGT